MTNLAVCTRLGSLLVATSLVAGCAGNDPPSATTETPLEDSAVQQLTTQWADAFAAAGTQGPQAIADTATAYIANVSPAHAEQISALFHDNSFTIGAMREAVAGADNQLGKFADALAQLDLIEQTDPDVMPASSLAFTRALDTAGVDARVGVLVQDAGKLHAFVAQLAALQPKTADSWSDMYAYQLGVGLVLDKQTQAAVDVLAPLVRANLDQSNDTRGLDALTLGSALNLTVSAYKQRGDLADAQYYLARTVELDDTYHLNFAGRFGEDTGALDTANPITHR